MGTVSHRSRAMLQSDNGDHLHTLVNWVNGISDGEISLDAIVSLYYRLEIVDMSIVAISQSYTNGELSEVVVVRPDIIKLNSYSILDEAILEETKAAMSARTGKSILNILTTPLIFWSRNCVMSYATMHPLFTSR